MNTLKPRLWRLWGYGLRGLPTTLRRQGYLFGWWPLRVKRRSEFRPRSLFDWHAVQHGWSAGRRVMYQVFHVGPLLFILGKKRRTALALILAAFAPAAWAGVTTCTSAMVTAGFCGATTDVLLHYSVPQPVQADFLAAYSEAANYQAELPCAETRVLDDGILIVAGYGDGTCALALDGQSVPNPQTPRVVVDRYIRRQIVEVVRRYKVQQAEEAARDTAEAEPDPEVNP